MATYLRFVVAVGVVLASSLPLRAARAQDQPSGSVYVELQTDNPAVRIDQVLPGGAKVPVCFAPCRRVLDRDGVYIIDGEGVVSTSQFSLPGDRPNLVLAVDSGSRTRQTVGGGLAIAGLLALQVPYLLVGGDDFRPPEQRTEPGETRKIAALILGAGGLVMGVVGVILLLTSSTHVGSSTGRSFSAAPPTPRKRPLFALTARGLEF